MLRALAIALTLAGLLPQAAGGRPWRWPVHGRIVGTFSVFPGDPYRAGQHRGIAIAARPGAPVRSACGGRVVFAGAVGSAGPTISVGCGRLRATYQGVSAVAVHRGAFVLPGSQLAEVSAGGVLRLGARAEPAPAHRPPGYVDPAQLLGAESRRLPPIPLGRAPLRRSPRPPLGKPDAPAPRVPPDAAATRVVAPLRPSRAPLLAWLGLALFASAAPIGTLAQRRRRRVRAARLARGAAAGRR